MSTYNPATDPNKLRDAIVAVFQKLRDELGNGVTLAEVTEKFNEVYGLDFTESDVAPYLSQNLQSRRQGVSSTSTAAGVASDNAASASADAAERGGMSAHISASLKHDDAAAAHDAASVYHRRASAWHQKKASGETLPELEAD
jgi:hypothetical protein